MTSKTLTREIGVVRYGRQEIIAAAKLKDADIGDGCMIAEMEYGYWIASVYVSKDFIKTVIRRNTNDQ